jgi:hypothetical protein
MTDRHPAAMPPSLPSRGRSGARRSTLGRVLGPAAGVTLMLGLGVLALRYSRQAAQPPRAIGRATASRPAEPAPFRPEVESRNFLVAEASGRVEALRGDDWVLIKPGDVLTKDDVVRTGVGRALLKLSGASEVELRERVEIRLDSISNAGASLDLRRGKVLAHVGRAGDNLAITAANTRTANAGGLPARFVVTADDKGRVAVAATEGSASVQAAGRVVTVTAGAQTRVEPGRPPIDPERIPEDILLTVTWPGGERHEERLPIAGYVAPGSQVRVNGAPTALDGAGRFIASVPIHGGPNAIEVVVDDVAGRSKRERREIRKIAEAPPLAPVRTNLWNGR